MPTETAANKADAPAGSDGAPPSAMSDDAIPVPPWEDWPEPVGVAADAGDSGTSAAAPVATMRRGDGETSVASVEAEGNWHALIRAMGLGGMVRELAQHCELVRSDEREVTLRLNATHRHLLSVNRAATDKIQAELGSVLGREIRLTIEIGEITGETPAQRDQQIKAEQHAAAVASLERDPFVRELIERFDATLLESSVRPLRTLQVESNP